MSDTWLGQILVEGEWLDYARGQEAESRRWQAGDPENRRVVDWIRKDRILVPAQAVVPEDAVSVTEQERNLLGGLLWDALSTTAEDQWSDYSATVRAFAKIALTPTLKDRYADLRRSEGFGFNDDEELKVVKAELQRRGEVE